MNTKFTSKHEQAHKHTGGDWKWGSPHGALTGEFGQVICWAASERGPNWESRDEEVTKANQRLLVASPELLKACMAALTWMNVGTPEGKESTRQFLLKSINKAINGQSA
jgi:dTDP-glucose pyrophosphorylase